MTISFPPVLFPNTPPSMDLPISATLVLTQDDLKRITAYKDVEFVELGMVVGLGTRSIAIHAVARIADLLCLGKLRDIVGMPTSTVTANQAHALGIPLSDLDRHSIVNLAINGVDEVDLALNLIKGRGGSLLRKKMVESIACRFVVIIDESKLIHRLSGSGLALPVEIVKHYPEFTLRNLQTMFEPAGAVAKLRISPPRPPPCRPPAQSAPPRPPPCRPHPPILPPRPLPPPVTPPTLPRRRTRCSPLVAARSSPTQI